MEGDYSQEDDDMIGDVLGAKKLNNVWHEVDVGGSSLDAILLDVKVGDIFSDPMEDMSFPLSKCQPHFVKASAECLAAFDFSELTGVFSYNKSVGSAERSLEDLNVSVLGVQCEVRVPKQILLKEVFDRLNLKICEMCLVIESCGVFSAWMEIQLPRHQSQGDEETQKLYGQGKNSKYEAVESVCELAIRDLCACYGVVVNDFSYPRMRMLEKKFREELEWNKMVQDLVQQQRKKIEIMKRQHTLVINKALNVCKKFADMLPATVPQGAVNSVELNSAGVCYSDQWRSVRDMEQFVSDLVHVLTDTDEFSAA